MERLFNLDPQLIHDAVLLALAVFVMFTFLSYLLFNPARDFLKKRQDKIKNDLDDAHQQDQQQHRQKREKLKADAAGSECPAFNLQSNTPLPTW